MDLPWRPADTQEERCFSHIKTAPVTAEFLLSPRPQLMFPDQRACAVEARGFLVFGEQRESSSYEHTVRLERLQASAEPKARQRNLDGP
ncbi:hypothetical protein NDU88_004520 [Pleurodeles waltl]|uniref:Uncharacterized protein n=1 Tax=Pleurodeles waltl TaxID=8319 RepID=A0AAV7W8H5_PLEWA|nr:hypothetical protein NDU88_004520 [Pleurodeles waltl]